MLWKLFKSFNDDPCQIKQHIPKRLAAGSDILKIVDGSAAKLPEHSPAEVALLQGAQPTLASVERSFSILKNLLSPGRNFNKNNVYFYLFFYVMKSEHNISSNLTV